MPSSIFLATASWLLLLLIKARSLSLVINPHSISRAGQGVCSSTQILVDRCFKAGLVVYKVLIDCTTAAPSCFDCLVRSFSLLGTKTSNPLSGVTLASPPVE